MNKFASAVFVVMAVAVVISALGTLGVFRAPTGGDFAGGITPTQLFTASGSTNSVTPVLPNMLLNGAISVGGQGTNYQTLATYYTTSSISSSTIGAYPNSTSTASTTVSLPVYLPIGTPCTVSAVSASSSFTFPVADAFDLSFNITAASSTTGTATGTLALQNGRPASLNIPSSTAVIKCDRPALAYP